MTTKEYEGWTNYETWAVKLWLDNDQELYRTQKDWLLYATKMYPSYTDGIWTKEEFLTFTIADCAKSLLTQRNPVTRRADVYSSLMDAALSEVNWNEIARAIQETHAEVIA